MLGKARLHAITLSLAAGFAIRALLRRGRGTHTIGVGAAGTFEASPDPRVPMCPFFEPGRTFPVRVRHATALRLDEASKDFRSIAVKLSEGPVDSPWDLIMNTGVVAGFWDSINFAAGAIGAVFGERGRRWYLERYPLAMENVRIGIRRAPESYARLYYYANVTFEYLPTDGRVLLARFRVAPHDLGPEAGVPAGEDASRPWFEDRLPGEDRPPDYLSREFRGRLDGGEPVRYRLQIRLHEPGPDDGLGFYHIGVDWPDEGHPWLDLGTLTLDRPLDDTETERLRFRIFHLPPALRVPDAASPGDPRSIGWMRVRVYPRLQAWRGALARLSGRVGPRWRRRADVARPPGGVS